ncbi:MAG: haloacid dehalogenase-like hydrolase [Opitutales bacterium]|nr:haloacid dehalogenase-like hydrolase [Opitutales bacterium]
MDSSKANLGGKHIIACVWDFDKTLIPNYMQTPIFEEYGVDEHLFWREVNMLPELYAKRGVRVSPETVYLNHLLSFVKSGKMRGLSNAKLRELGARIKFAPGALELFDELKKIPLSDERYRKLDIKLEHYIVSTGISEMIKGSAIAPKVDGVFACEFIEEPLPPYFSAQTEFDWSALSNQINQIGAIVDNTIKTRFIFEINKGANKNSVIDVNAQMSYADRRVPIENMIYVADGPSDVPVFSVVRKGGGKTYAVYSPESDAEFEQNDMLLQSGRIDAYGPCDYSDAAPTARWLKMHVRKICDRIVKDFEAAVASRVGKSPKHIRKNDDVKEFTEKFLRAAERHSPPAADNTAPLDFGKNSDD